MRKKFIAGNWKMNLDRAGAAALAAGLKEKLAGGSALNTVDVALCPPFVYLCDVQSILAGTKIGLGAQDVYFEANGAFTGEISTAMLKDVGCRYVILGQSERRHVIGENDDLINRKLRAALTAGLDPILCIGELLLERENNKTNAVLEKQLRAGLANLSAGDMKKVTIAYEPVWAIGTGKTASPAQAQEAHAFSRKILHDLFGEPTAQATRIQYGGSVKASNAAELMCQADVDGVLVGGASLKVDEFLGIILGGASACGGG